MSGEKEEERVSILCKFGIIQVQNLPRRLKARRVWEGVATNLKTDIQFMFLG
jgi:hypothetical protein